MLKQPKNIVYRAEYEPDMTRMVKALRVLLEYNPPLKDDVLDSARNPVAESLRSLCDGGDPIEQMA